MKTSAEKIACLTAYDASFARLEDEAGVDFLLVGDSLGMVLQGSDTTLKVTMADMIYHTRLVSAVTTRAIIVSDMPFMSYNTPAQALGNAGRLITEGGAQMVKLEGGSELTETIKLITQHGIPVCGHLGLTPQSIHKIGGYRVQARSNEAAKKLKEDAVALQQAGAECLVLECVPAALAADITRALEIPVIGIGAGTDCDGQVLVVYDMLGITARQPKFSKNFLTGKESVADALRTYVEDVKNKTFPAAIHTYD